MLESSIEWSVEQINENFKISAELDKYTFDLGGDALTFAKSVWDVSMVLAAVVFAIVACLELYSLSVRNEARGGPMGSAEIVFRRGWRFGRRQGFSIPLVSSRQFLPFAYAGSIGRSLG